MRSAIVAGAFAIGAAAAPLAAPQNLEPWEHAAQWSPPGAGGQGGPGFGGPGGPWGPPETESGCEISWVTVEESSSSALPESSGPASVPASASAPPYPYSSSGFSSSVFATGTGTGYSYSYSIHPTGTGVSYSSNAGAQSSSAAASSVYGGSSSAPAPASSSVVVVSSSAAAGSSAAPSSAPASSPAPSSTGWGSAPTGKHPFPYPSGTIVVTGTDPWTITYSAPTQMEWKRSDGKFETGSVAVTSYVLTTTDSASQTGVTTTTTSEAACSSAPSSYVSGALKKTNEYRAQHGANPVVWDYDLACVAQRQADSCLFDHLTYVDGGNYGQNLAMGGGLSIESSVDMWYGEEDNFSYYGEQNPGGNFEDYGHFTQLVWAYTTSIGCASKDCNGSNLVVCNYFAGGNMADMYGVYVLPKKS